MNIRRPFALQVVLASMALNGHDMSFLRGTPGTRETFMPGRMRFSPAPDAQFLRRQTVTREQRRRRGEVVR